MQTRDQNKIGFMETFTGDPFMKAYESRKNLISARERVREDFARSYAKLKAQKDRQ